MAKKMSATNALPAFILPRSLREWTTDLNKAGVEGIAEQKPEDRDYSILGGGDIGFPLLLVASVYFAHGSGKALIISAFTLAGLASAYLVQKTTIQGETNTGNSAHSDSCSYRSGISELCYLGQRV